MNKINPATIIILAILVSLTIGWTYTYPAFSRIATAESSLQSADTRLQTIKKEIKKLQKINAEQHITSEQQDLYRSLPKGKDIPALIRMLESLTPYDQVGDSDKKYLKTFSIKEVKENKRSHKKYGELIIRANIESSYQAFIKFLQKLERPDQRLITVEKINIKRKEHLLNQDLYKEAQYTVIMHAYYQKE